VKENEPRQIAEELLEIFQGKAEQGAEFMTKLARAYLTLEARCATFKRFADYLAEFDPTELDDRDDGGLVWIDRSIIEDARAALSDGSQGS
jgi:hypothetical protein